MGVEGRPRAAGVRGAAATALLVLAAAALAGCGRQDSPEGAPASPPDSAADETLTLGAQAGALSPEALAAVRAKTGLRLRQKPAASPTELESRLLAGGSGFDVVVVPWQFVALQVRAGLFQTLDKRQLPSLAHLDDGIMEQLAADDRGNELAVPCRRQTAGLAVDRQRFATVIGDADPFDWSMLFDPLNATKLATCGVYVPDAGEEMLALALLWLGRDPNSEASEDFAAAAAALRAIKPYVQAIDPAQFPQELKAGKPCLAVVHDAAVAARGGLDYGVPLQGTIARVDVLAIPADARQSRAAHTFIDALIAIERKPEGEATAHAQAKSLVLAPHSEAHAGAVARLWAEFAAR